MKMRRDQNSNALVSTDAEAYKRAKKRKMEARKKLRESRQTNDINTRILLLEKRIAKLEAMLAKKQHLDKITERADALNAELAAQEEATEETEAS